MKLVIEEIFDTVEGQLKNGAYMLPKSNIAKSINYTLNLKESLQTFLENPCCSSTMVKVREP